MVLTAVGSWLFVAPTTEAWLGPWDLTGLTSRSVAAWLLASATLGHVLVREPGAARVMVPAAAYALQPVLMLVASRGSGTRWRDSSSRPGLVVMLVVMSASGLYGVALSHRSAKPVKAQG